MTNTKFRPFRQIKAKSLCDSLVRVSKLRATLLCCSFQKIKAVLEAFRLCINKYKTNEQLFIATRNRNKIGWPILRELSFLKENDS